MGKKATTINRKPTVTSAVIFATALVGGCQVETRQVEPEEAGDFPLT